MKRKHLLLILTIFIGVMFMAPQLMAGDHCKAGKKCCGLEECIPNLTPAQKADIEKLHKKSKEKMEALHEKLEKLESELMALKMDPAKKKEINAKIDGIFKLKAEARKECFATCMSVKQILTAEQLKHLESKECGPSSCKMKHGEKDCCKKECKMEHKKGCCKKHAKHKKGCC